MSTRRARWAWSTAPWTSWSTQALFDREAKRLHVVIGDPQIYASIAAIPGLAGPDGKIDKFKFAMGLQNRPG